MQLVDSQWVNSPWSSGQGYFWTSVKQSRSAAQWHTQRGAQGTGVPRSALAQQSAPYLDKLLLQIIDDWRLINLLVNKIRSKQQFLVPKIAFFIKTRLIRGVVNTFGGRG